LAARIAQSSGAKFTKVLSAIDKMIKVLEGEDDDDLSNKEDCEKDRAADTKEAAGLSRSIDELSDDMSKLEGEIKQASSAISEKETSVKDLQKEVKDANKIRQDENSEWKLNDKDDSAAVALLEQSAGVLKSFYKNNFALMQQSNSEKGAQSPPAPKTWEGGYGGAKKESTGIVGILDLIKADVEKDQKAAKSAEETSQKEHDKFVTESEGSIKDLNAAISDLSDKNAKRVIEISSKKATSGNKKGSLDTVVEKMKKAAPGCDFLLVNFKVRIANRKMEIDGLNKAKTILKAHGQ